MLYGQVGTGEWLSNLKLNLLIPVSWSNSYAFAPGALDLGFKSQTTQIVQCCQRLATTELLQAQCCKDVLCQLVTRLGEIQRAQQRLNFCILLIVNGRPFLKYPPKRVFRIKSVLLIQKACSNVRLGGLTYRATSNIQPPFDSPLWKTTFEQQSTKQNKYAKKRFSFVYRNYGVLGVF